MSRKVDSLGPRVEAGERRENWSQNGRKLRHSRSQWTKQTEGTEYEIIPRNVF